MTHRCLRVFVGILCLALALPSFALAFDLSWLTTDAGGADSLSDGQFSLSASIGQLDAGWMTDGQYVLQAGYRGSGPVRTSVDDPIPTTFRFRLLANVPNPFNPSTEIRFELAAPGSVHLRLFTARGEVVRTLGPVFFEAGPQALVWNGLDDRGRPASSGVYLVELRTGADRAHGKLLLLK